MRADEGVGDVMEAGGAFSVREPELEDCREVGDCSEATSRAGTDMKGQSLQALVCGRGAGTMGKPDGWAGPQSGLGT